MSVYFALAGGYVKVGYSAKPFGRMTTVTRNGRRPTDLPHAADVELLGWVPGDRDVEAAWHRRFAADHVAGEWFYLAPDMVRSLIWSDPCGVDLVRMPAPAVFAAIKYPAATRDDLARAGYTVEAAPADIDIWGGAA